MAVKVVVGAQFGDEGKGKIVDWLAQDADMIVRFQGGDNAGHTVINRHGVFKLHIIPCGIFNSGCKCLIGTGTVVNPDVLIEEMEMFQNAGISLENLLLSDRAQLIMPWHVALDEAMERSGGIGTTKRGIGQAYAEKYLRKNFRAGDLRSLDKEKLSRHLKYVNAMLSFYGAKTFSPDEIMEKALIWQKKVVPLLCDALDTIHTAIMNNDNIIFEGQLGAMKDIDHGIYPFVTSSNPVAAYAAVSGGFSPKKIDCIVGVCKAFSSAVGDGPFPTEMPDADAAMLRGSGTNPDDEYGARTGRSRRIGWLDLPVLRFANLVNGFDELALTKLDKLDSLPEIKICTHYKLNGRIISNMPNTSDLYKVEPVYETLPGWLSDTTRCKTFDELPENARKYVDFISNYIGVPIRYIGNGPGRENIILHAI
ncbi:MAG TPA: adenylosuccinate synthase [Clostridiales bacterium]|nr:adenylosuccinate synthase [Clostridiales bacterium]